MPKTVLPFFHGPEGYISPSYYATKVKHGKVVPTWNYVVVHVQGRAEIVDDSAWVRNQIEQLTQLKENAREQPWKVDDAPAAYTETLFNSLVGVKISISRIEAKTKASQNQPKENQQSVLESLDSEFPDSDLTKLMHSVLD